MEYKNTIEALHYNAEEIRKLVASLENSNNISRIDIDLILQKIRSMYDLMLDIQATVTYNKDLTDQPEQTLADTNPPQETDVTKPELKHDEIKAATAKKTSDIIFDDETVLLKEKMFFKPPAMDHIHEKSDEEKLIERKQTAKENIEKDLKKEKEKLEENALKKSFISDRFKVEKPTIHDELASKSKQEDVASHLKSQGVSGFTSSLGLNEKFELINELFDGNREKFEHTLQVLNMAGSFVEAYNYLKDNFNWNMDHPHVQRLLEQIRRKLIVNRNDE
jgi:hypothetical protein